MSKKLIIELDIDLSDWEDSDIKSFLREAKYATGINVEIGRPVSEKHSEVSRLFTLSTEYFKVNVK